jgi:hypothetical protein
MPRRSQGLIGDPICFLLIRVSWLVNLKLGLQIEPAFLATFSEFASWAAGAIALQKIAGHWRADAFDRGSWFG